MRTWVQPPVSVVQNSQGRHSNIRGASFCINSRVHRGSCRRKDWCTCGSGGKESSGMERLVGVPTLSDSYNSAHNSSQTPMFGSWLLSMSVVGLATIAGLCSAFTCFVLYIKPILKSLDDTCEATSDAAKKLESAADELEQAALMFQDELPPAVNAVEQASKEFQELGETLNALSRTLTGFQSKSRNRQRRYRGKNGIQKNSDDSGERTEDQNHMEPVSNITKVDAGAISSMSTTINTTTEGIHRQTMAGISKVAEDITSLARNLTPAMDMWQSQLAGIVSKVEVEAKSKGSQDALEYVRDRLKRDSSTSLPWIGSWKKDEPSSPVEVPRVADETEVESSDEDSAVENALDGVCVAIDNEFSLDEEDGSVAQVLPQLTQELDDILQNVSDLQSKPDSAVAVIEALYKAEQAAEHAAQASGNLQAAVKRAQISGAFDGLSEVEHADGMADVVQRKELSSDWAEDKAGINDNKSV